MIKEAIYKIYTTKLLKNVKLRIANDSYYFNYFYTAILQAINKKNIRIV